MSGPPNTRPRGAVAEDGMTSNVRILPIVTSEELSPIAMLEAAKNGDLQKVVIVGIDADGNSFFSSSIGDAREVNWMLELAKRDLMDMYKKMSDA